MHNINTVRSEVKRSVALNIMNKLLNMKLMHNLNTVRSEAFDNFNNWSNMKLMHNLIILHFAGGKYI